MQRGCCDSQTTVLKALPPIPSCDRKFALTIARSLLQSLWFHEVDWDNTPLRDSPASTGLYCFTGDEQADQTTVLDSEDDMEIPTGVLTSVTPCMSPYCGKMDEEGLSSTCYSYSCPNRAKNQLVRHGSLLSVQSGQETVSSAS